MVEMVYPKTDARPYSGANDFGDCACLLIVNLDRAGTFVSGDRAFALAAGDLLLVDRHAPLHREAPNGCRDVRVYLPNVSTHERYKLPVPAEPCHIDGRDGIGAVLRDVIHAVLFGETPLCPREEEAVRDAVLILVGAAYCVRRDRCQRRRRESDRAVGGMSDAPRQWRLLVACIEAQLSDPELSPASVAAMQGVSIRHLHRLFRQAGVSFGNFVRRRRLERCRDDLSDPRFDGLPLTEIAYRWGFSDSSHFSRCFPSAFGCTAREFRAGQACARPTPYATAHDDNPNETKNSWTACPSTPTI